MTDMQGNIHKEITIPNRIFLKGFPPSTTEKELEKNFEQHGKIVGTKIIRDQKTNQSKGYAFITFDSQAVCENVLATCKSVDLNGAEITVCPAKIRRHRNRLFRYSSNLSQHPAPRNVPFTTVWPDGLHTYDQPSFVPNYYSYFIEHQAPAEGDPYNSLSSMNDASTIDHATVTSKPGTENTRRYEQTSEPNSNKKSPVKATPTDHDYCFNPVEVNRKALGQNQLPLATQFVNVNGPSVDLNGLTTIYGHPLNGNLDVFCNRNMANLTMIPAAYVHLATKHQELTAAVDPNNIVKPDMRRKNHFLGPSIPNRYVSNRISNPGGRINGEPPHNFADLKKGQQFANIGSILVY